MPDRPATLANPQPSSGSYRVAMSNLAADERAKGTTRRKPGVWQRRIVNPVRRLLTRGVSPDRIAATVATGTVCSLCPIFGTTTILNVAAGVWLRMNHPILQALNQLYGPLQLVMIVGYVRFGGWLFGGRNAFSLAEVTRMFEEATFADFLEKFGRAGLHGFLAWILTAPVLFGVVYVPARAVTRRFSARKAGAGSGF